MQTYTEKNTKSKALSVPDSDKTSASNNTTGTFVDNRALNQKATQLQAMANQHKSNHQAPVQKKENQTGLSDGLKAGIETLSGYSMDDVKVHYNSDKPAQLQAHAYAQGTDIHVASGQEKHVAHEAWHVVQQKQGRVKPTTQLKEKVQINDSATLEKEADVMGAKALQTAVKSKTIQSKSKFQGKTKASTESVNAPVQRMKFAVDKGSLKPSKEVQEKLDQVNPVLAHIAAGFGSDKQTVKLQLINEGGMSPAYSSHDHFKKGKDTKYTGDVVIQLNLWYAERASVGDIIGMLTHELGVHAMADFEMGMVVDKDEDLAMTPKSPFTEERDEEVNTHTTKDKLKYGPHTLKPIDRKNSDKDRRQEDHVNIGKGIITGKVKNRAQIYLHSFLRAGDAIAHKDSKVQHKTQQLRDLIQSFLFDVARIVATDDGTALSMFTKTEAIAELMNYYQAGIVHQHGKDHDWLNMKELQLNASGWGLRGHLLSLVGELIKSSNPSVKRGKTSLGVGGAVALGLWGFGTLAALPAIGVGAVAGAGVWGVSKLLGY